MSNALERSSGQLEGFHSIPSQIGPFPSLSHHGNQNRSARCSEARSTAAGIASVLPNPLALELFCMAPVSLVQFSPGNHLLPPTPLPRRGGAGTSSLPPPPASPRFPVAAPPSPPPIASAAFDCYSVLRMRMQKCRPCRCCALPCPRGQKGRSIACATGRK